MKRATYFYAALLLIAGCATGSSSSGKVFTAASNNVLLAPAMKGQNRALIKITNPTDQEQMRLGESIKGGLAAKGYQIVDTPEQADFTLLGSVVQAGEMEPEALKAAYKSSYGNRIALVERHKDFMSKAVGALVDGASAKSYGIILDLNVQSRQETKSGVARQESKTRIVSGVQASRQSAGEAMAPIEKEIVRQVLSIF